MRSARLSALLLSWLFIGTTLFAQQAAPPTTGGVSNDAIRSKQEAQKRAEVMARELVGSILDIQIRHLEENNLKHLEVIKKSKRCGKISTV